MKDKSDSEWGCLIILVPIVLGIIVPFPILLLGAAIAFFVWLTARE